MARGLSEVTVRRGTPRDAEGFWRCLDAVAHERRWLAFLRAPSLEDVESFIRDSDPIQFVAVRGDQVVGWCDVTSGRHEGFRHSGRLGMGLLLPFRGRGLGWGLLRETLAAARAEGLTRIELEVLASNRRAISLYERNGFANEGRKRAARILDGRAEDLPPPALERCGVPALDATPPLPPLPTPVEELFDAARTLEGLPGPWTRWVAVVGEIDRVLAPSGGTPERGDDSAPVDDPPRAFLAALCAARRSRERDRPRGPEHCSDRELRARRRMQHIAPALLARYLQALRGSLL